MSNYPHNPPYGANPNPSYLLPAYPNQYLQQQPDGGRAGHSPMANGYDANMNAYGYNRNAPTFSPAAVASGVPPLPIFQGWNQDSMPLPPYTAPQTGGQYNNNGYGENVQSQQQQYYPPVQQNYQPQSHGFQNKPYEADEGEFDDGSAANNIQSVGYGAAQYRGNDGTGYIDTAQRALYPRAQDYSPQQSYPANNYNYPQRDQAQARRQPSGSYSPYAAAIVPNNAERPSGSHHQNSYSQGHLRESSMPPTPIVPVPVAIPAKPTSWPQKSAQQPEPKSIPKKPSSLQNGAKQSQTQRATPAASVSSTIPTAMKGPDAIFSKSLSEERKSAQGAIHKAHSLGIRLKQYVEEGIDEDVVKRLFLESNLSPSSNESINGSENGGKAQVEEARAIQQQTQSLQTLQSSSQNGYLAGAPRSPKTATPLLSISTNGNLASTTQTTSDQVTTPTTAAAPKSVSMIEKDKALKSKMDALKKSREDRAQKAAARSGSTSNAPIVTATQEDVSKRLPDKAVAATVEPTLVHATNSFSKSPSVPKNDLSLPAKPSFLQDSSAPEPSTKPAPIQHPLPAIPGLFLASSAPTPTPQIPSSAIQSPVQGNLRKRPVAADFDDPVATMASFKRPFGHNRNDAPLVIDVSDEEMDSEDEDVAMDLESVADDAPAQLTRKQSENSTAQQQAIPSSTTQPKRSPPLLSSAANTPPPIARPLPAQPEGTLQHKMSEIEVLKKRIAEYEAKKKTKRTGSGAQTPRPIETASVGSNVIHQQNGLSLLPQKPTIDEEEKAVHEPREQAGLPVAEATDLLEQKRLAVEQSRISAEQKRMRRVKMASDIAALRAADEQRLREIERRRAEVEQMEALRIQDLENQRKLEEQMLLLAEDEDEEEHSSQLSEVVASEAPEIPVAHVAHVSDHPVNPEMADQTSALPSNLNATQVEAVATSHPDQAIEARSQDIENSAQADGVSLAIPSHSTFANGLHQSDDHSVVSRAASEDRMDEPKSSLSADQALEAALQEAARIEADLHANGEEDIEEGIVEDVEEDVEMDISPIAEYPEAQDPISDAIEEVPNSPEYSPELHRDIPEVPDLPDRESDDYEPPDASPPMNTPALNGEVVEAPVVSSPSPIDSPPFSPAPPAEIPAAEDMVLDPSVEEASEIVIYDEQVPAADLAPSQMIEEPTEGPRSFVPYDSPLKHFRSYRFHPQFQQEIPGGLRSMTYSHKINANKELCRYELAGGICNDQTCDLQHFREIGLPDDAVLTALGSPDEFSGEQRERFCVGLKEVLLRMRQHRVRDFNEIASEIIAHRKKFLGDDSKVLPLAGTTI